MSYAVGQYNYVSGTNIDFLTPISSGYTATRYPGAVNSGVTSLDEEYPFDEECIYYSGSVSSGFAKNTTYYLHCRILQIDTTQTFNIKLTNMEDSENTQFIKKIVVQKNSIGSASFDSSLNKAVVTPGNNWVDLELVFTPVTDFNCLVFDLVRSVGSGDYSTETLRYPCIIYNELSVVNNPYEIFNSDNNTVVKIGVQSHPGFFMVINSEPIKIGRSGSYELHSDLLESINSFAAVEAASDDALMNKQLEMATLISTNIFYARGTVVAYKGQNSGKYYTLDEYENVSAYLKPRLTPIYIDKPSVLLSDWTEGGDSPSSAIRLDVSKTRTTSSFVLDYMYKDE